MDVLGRPYDEGVLTHGLDCRRSERYGMGFHGIRSAGRYEAERRRVGELGYDQRLGAVTTPDHPMSARGCAS